MSPKLLVLRILPRKSLLKPCLETTLYYYRLSARALPFLKLACFGGIKATVYRP
jgi:hypothetical protein